MNKDMMSFAISFTSLIYKNPSCCHKTPLHYCSLGFATCILVFFPYITEENFLRTRMDKFPNEFLLVIIKKITVLGSKISSTSKKHLIVIASLSTRKPLSDCFWQTIWGFLLMIRPTLQRTDSCKGLPTVDMHWFAWYWQLAYFSNPNLIWKLSGIF